MKVHAKRVPPLRSDRDTVVIGTFTGNGPFPIQMTAEGPGGPQQLSWSARPGQPNEDYNYLVKLVDRAKLGGGLSLPITGSASLEEIRKEVHFGVRSLSRLAREAFSAGNLDSAEKLAQAALDQDPGNPEALAVKAAVAKKQQNAGPAAAVGPVVVDEPVVGPAPASGVPAT